ncbi:hypothetical protein NDU88_005640 [Pleurodeles waltl]|uniref:Uncharacterized protein n=1 Tax=Pleurodeles waltl TaxID=8319 RepID=A0AAV7NX69_PLEWA|nr:hypothetical protein NDU88_005640 [Pleurodeles waltl]
MATNPARPSSQTGQQGARPSTRLHNGSCKPPPTSQALRETAASNVPECRRAGEPASDPWPRPRHQVKSGESRPGPAPLGSPTKHANPGGQIPPSPQQQRGRSPTQPPVRPNHRSGLGEEAK